MTRSVEIPEGVGLYPLDNELVKEFTRHAFPDGSVSEAMCDALEAASPRSVEIPEARARVAEFVRQWGMMRDIVYGVHADPASDETADLLASDLRVLLAALPYLAPAEPCPTCNGREWINGQWVARRETVGMVCQTCGTDYAPSPAGDGGLRHALEQLADLYEEEGLRADDGVSHYRIVGGLRHLLKAHPAAPAVPQPVDREALVRVLSTHNIECTSPGEVTCRGCRDRGWMSWSAYRQHLADAVLAVLAGVEVKS